MILVIFGIILFILFIVIVICMLTPICDGGELISGCGKPLFPWRKKFKLPSGKYCCMQCYLRDLKQFSDIRQDSNGDMKLVFRDEDDYDRDTEDRNKETE